ncbi:hypothetical protein MUG78_14805 [Gordonia alkaliphila]|uniref:hypothetical protein n=1 Tax=Gordonia alkaliphila TaxID=1053547 RepID=UPI001FF181BA|nr:hypothetical protein [Gordonia alkaliphila]MCK0440688.1 hypothetical protein [Gordonia alkaliphila]
MNATDIHHAHTSLEAVGRARHQIREEAGLPRWYWWFLAASWVLLGVIGGLAPDWAAIVATVLFGAGNAALASRLYDGTRPGTGVRLRRSQVGRALPWLIIAILVAMVALTVGAALWLAADGAAHPAIIAGVLVAAIVGFGGPELLRVLRRAVHV